ncbi:MAG: hypothetical protein MHPSP_002686, partial [Paramarteilia canceri]
MFERTVFFNGTEEITNSFVYNTLYNYYEDNNNLNKYLKCPVGKGINNPDKNRLSQCNGCTIYYKYLKTDSDFKCIKCPSFTIAGGYNGHTSLSCDISYNEYKSNEVLSTERKEVIFKGINDILSNERKEVRSNEIKDVLSKEKYLCSKYLDDSIGRKENTPPIIDYCQCPDNMPRVNFGKSFFGIKAFQIKSYCLTQKSALKLIDSSRLDYAVRNFVFNNPIEFIFYKICNPDRDYLVSYADCLCPPKQIYSDGKCKLCTYSDPVDPEYQVKCTKCPIGKILTLNGKDCMCPYSDVPQSNNCEEATKNEKICSGNLVLNNGKCILCPENQIKSKITGQCICPE